MLYLLTVLALFFISCYLLLIKVINVLLLSFHSAVFGILFLNAADIEISVTPSEPYNMIFNPSRLCWETWRRLKRINIWMPPDTWMRCNSSNTLSWIQTRVWVQFLSCRAAATRQSNFIMDRWTWRVERAKPQEFIKDSPWLHREEAYIPNQPTSSKHKHKHIPILCSSNPHPHTCTHTHTKPSGSVLLCFVCHRVPRGQNVQKTQTDMKSLSWGALFWSGSTPCCSHDAVWLDIFVSFCGKLPPSFPSLSSAQQDMEHSQKFFCKNSKCYDSDGV